MPMTWLRPVDLVEPAADPDAGVGDMHLVRRAAARDGDAFRIIMKTHNRRLYRLARGIVRNDAEAEDIVQEAYVRAFTHLDTFRAESSLSTWLSRIVMNEALGRLRQRVRYRDKVRDLQETDAEIIRFPYDQRSEDPERTIAQRQILRLVEKATDSLPTVYRTVFVARVIEGMSAEDTAELHGIKPETVKSRLNRARSLLRQHLSKEIGPLLLDAFPFAGRRCARLSLAVMVRIGFPH